MSVLEKILEDIKAIGGIRFSRYTEMLIAVKDVEKIIRSHMDEMDKTVFKFDFNRVKSFDCQCGRHYVNTDNDGWIPVEERLPDAGNGKYYPLLNVAISYGAVKCGFYRVRDKQWYIYKEIYNEFVEARDKEIVAWQYFPEPYKAK